MEEGLQMFYRVGNNKGAYRDNGKEHGQRSRVRV